MNDLILLLLLLDGLKKSDLGGEEMIIKFYFTILFFFR